MPFPLARVTRRRVFERVDKISAPPGDASYFPLLTIITIYPIFLVIFNESVNRRMKLTSKSEYALLALVFLARQAGKGAIPVHAIAAAQQIPPKFLEQILLALKRARFLRSVKGKGGGFCLARRPNAISLADIIRLFDGALAPTESVSHYFYESTPIEKEKRLLGVFRDIRDLVARRMERTTLADVI